MFLLIGNCGDVADYDLYKKFAKISNGHVYSIQKIWTDVTKDLDKRYVSIASSDGKSDFIDIFSKSDVVTASDNVNATIHAESMSNVFSYGPHTEPSSNMFDISSTFLSGDTNIAVK